MPTRLRSSVTSMEPSYTSRPPTRIRPVIRTSSTRSFMRLRQRKSVVLPQPEGPMKAVTRFFGTRIEMPLSAGLSP